MKLQRPPVNLCPGSHTDFKEASASGPNCTTSLTLHLLTCTNLQSAPIPRSKHIVSSVCLAPIQPLNVWHKLSVCLLERDCNLSSVLLQCSPSSLEMDTISSILDAWCWYLLGEIQHSFTSSRWVFAIHILYFHCLAPSSCAIISGLLTFGLCSFSGDCKNWVFILFLTSETD